MNDFTLLIARLFHFVLLTLIVGLLFMIDSNGQSASIPATLHPTTSFPKEETIKGLMTKYKVAAVGIGIIEEGKISYLKVFGENKPQHPAPTNTIFNVASIAKPMAALLTLKLINAGQWELNQPLARYWIDPDIKDHPWHKILTTRHVLTHQTGFINWRSNHPSGKLTFEFKPGTQYQYSGEGFEYLRLALEAKFHIPYERLLDSLVLTPCRMKESGFWSDQIDLNRFAAWYDAQGKPYQVSFQTGAGAADDFLTTVEDLCKVGIQVIRGAGLSSTLYKEMIRPQGKVNEHYGWGLGWGVVTGLKGGEYALEHGGSDMGVKAQVIYLPISKRGIVVLTNGDNGMHIYKKVIKETFDIGEDIAESMYPRPAARKAITLSDQVLKRYTGTYMQPTDRPLQIALDGNMLNISGSGWPLIELYAENENKFYDLESNLELIFEHDQATNETKATVYEDGKRLMIITKAN